MIGGGWIGKVAGSFITTGLCVNDKGQLDFAMTPDKWGLWGATAFAGFLNDGVGIGRMAGGLTGSFLNGDLYTTVGYGVQRTVEGFTTSMLREFALGVDYSSLDINNIGGWRMTNYNWHNVARETTMEGVNGFVSGGVASMLGGSYNAKEGKIEFLDRKTTTALGSNVMLFYGDRLVNFAQTMGSIAGEAVNFGFGGNFRISLGQGVGLGITREGRLTNDASGGISLKGLVDAFGSMNYVKFQYNNVHGGNEGLSRISIVNNMYYVSMLTKDSIGLKAVFDVINGERKIIFDQEERIGYAGEDCNIHLNKGLVSSIWTKDDLLIGTSTALREAILLENWSRYGEVDNVERQRWEQEVSGEQVEKMLAMMKMYGIKGGELGKSKELMNALAYFAVTGDSSGFKEIESGRALHPILITIGASLFVTHCLINKLPNNEKNREMKEFTNNLGAVLPENEDLKKLIKGENGQDENSKKKAFETLVKITNQYRIFNGLEEGTSTDLGENVIMMEFLKQRKKAMEIGLYRYAGENSKEVLKLAETNKNEFEIMLERKIIRAAMTKKDVNDININTNEGQMVLKEYEYFAKIVTVKLGGKWEDVKDKWNKADFFMISEEGLGSGYKPAGFRGHFYNDRITVFKGDMIVEFRSGECRS